jgi:hypothetical protein
MECFICDREYHIVWKVQDKIWDKVVALGSIKDKTICLECFLHLAGDDSDKLRIGHFEVLNIGGAQMRAS